MNDTKNPYTGYRYPAEIIIVIPYNFHNNS